MTKSELKVGRMNRNIIALFSPDRTHGVRQDFYGAIGRGEQVTPVDPDPHDCLSEFPKQP